MCLYVFRKFVGRASCEQARVVEVNNAICVISISGLSAFLSSGIWRLGRKGFLVLKANPVRLIAPQWATARGGERSYRSRDVHMASKQTVYGSRQVSI
jgi:hypothetical protein